MYRFDQSKIAAGPAGANAYPIPPFIMSVQQSFNMLM